MTHHDTAPSAEQHEFLDSVKLVLGGITKESGRNPYWKTKFEIGPDFKGDPDQKFAVYSALGEILKTPSGIIYSWADKCLVRKRAIAIEREDTGEDDKRVAAETLSILNSTEVKEALKAYFVFLDKKKEVHSLLDK